MKTLEARFHFAARQRRGRGAAVLVILVLLAVMSAIAIANTRTLHALKQELQLLDQRQKHRLSTVRGP